jgi:hypothetical protein
MTKQGQKSTFDIVVLTRAQINQLLYTVRMHWIRMEQARLAYEENQRKADRIAWLLNLLTMVAGVITGLSSISMRIFTRPEVLTSIAGGITGILTLAKITYTPERKSQDYWDSSRILKDLQDRLITRAVGFNDSQSVEKETTFLEYIGNNIATATKLKIDITENHERKAQQNYDQLNLVSVFQITPPPGEPGYKPEGGEIDFLESLRKITRRRRRTGVPS